MRRDARAEELEPLRDLDTSTLNSQPLATPFPMLPVGRATRRRRKGALTRP